MSFSGLALSASDISRCLNHFRVLIVSAPFRSHSILSCLSSSSSMVCNLLPMTYASHFSFHWGKDFWSCSMSKLGTLELGAFGLSGLVFEIAATWSMSNFIAACCCWRSSFLCFSALYSWSFICCCIMFINMIMSGDTPGGMTGFLWASLASSWRVSSSWSAMFADWNAVWLGLFIVSSVSDSSSLYVYLGFGFGVLVATLDLVCLSEGSGTFLDLGGINANLVCVQHCWSAQGVLEHLPCTPDYWIDLDLLLLFAGPFLCSSHTLWMVRSQVVWLGLSAWIWLLWVGPFLTC